MRAVSGTVRRGVSTSVGLHALPQWDGDLRDTVQQTFQRSLTRLEDARIPVPRKCPVKHTQPIHPSSNVRLVSRFAPLLRGPLLDVPVRRGLVVTVVDSELRRRSRRLACGRLARLQAVANVLGEGAVGFRG